MTLQYMDVYFGAIIFNMHMELVSNCSLLLQLSKLGNKLVLPFSPLCWPAAMFRQLPAPKCFVLAISTFDLNFVMQLRQLIPYC